MIRHYRDAQLNWTPTNWEKFLERANEDAQLDQIRELAKTADIDTLRETVNLLCDRLSLIGQKTAQNKADIANAQREIRRMSGVIRGR
jgi:hypothetical protein